MLFNLLEFNSETFLKSLEILWKGLLAIVVVVGIIILVTYIMQYISRRISESKEKKSDDGNDIAPSDEK